MEYKLVIVVREDLGLSPGKMCVQVAHAAVMCAMSTKAKKTSWYHSWAQEGQKKVVVKAFDMEHLNELRRAAMAQRLCAELVTDAGLTEVAPGTVTCLGVGPGPDNIVDKVTAKLKLM